MLCARVDASLAEIPTTGLQVRQLIQSFLDARQSALPKPTHITTTGVSTEDSQESQDDYGSFDFDIDDPVFLAALGEAPKSADYTKEEETVCKVDPSICLFGVV